MPKPSVGNFKNNNDQHNIQQQNQNNLPHRGTLSYENLSSLPPGGANCQQPTQNPLNPVYYQTTQNETLNHTNALTAQQINALTQQLTYSSIHQQKGSNQSFNHNIQADLTHHHGSFGNISTSQMGRAGGVISSGVSSSSTTSLDETQNTVVPLSSIHQQQSSVTGRNAISSNNLNNEQTSAVQGDPTSSCQIALPEGWDMGRDYDGKIYFINHHSQTTTWVDPRER